MCMKPVILSLLILLIGGRLLQVLCHRQAHPTALLYNFFEWKLNQKVNDKTGRKMRTVKKKSSLGID